MTVHLIPRPAHLHLEEGTLPVSPTGEITAQGEGAQDAAQWLRSRLTGPGVPVQITAGPTFSTHPEAYELRVTPRGITLTGLPDGLLRGVATLAQVLEQHPAEVPCLTVRDEPRFAYRGMMLDVSRHFMPLGDVKALIDELAALKFNTFHWHLTDDQGWRIEIKRYPKLTEVGAWRRRTLKGHASAEPAEYDDTPHGGFYTQDDVREVVAYAAARRITVIPEIDLPGHAQAAQAAYPELSCRGEALEVWDRWGINHEVYCTRDQTFTFLQGVLDEVIDLFPSRTVHIGGDEVETGHWAGCPDCREVMRREGLTRVKELEGYFIGRIAQYLTGKGVRVIGWDEITEGPLPPGVTVMSWRGFEGGIDAARRGFDVIMSPQSHVYLDHYQGDRETEPLAIGGFSDLHKTYSFEPIPPELTPGEARHILGGQANLWREYIPDTAHVQYMAFPRLHAVAEALWTPREGRDWNDFQRRLPAVLGGLPRRGVNFRALDQADDREAEDHSSLP